MKLNDFSQSFSNPGPRLQTIEQHISLINGFLKQTLKQEKLVCWDPKVLWKKMIYNINEVI